MVGEGEAAELDLSAQVEVRETGIEVRLAGGILKLDEACGGGESGLRERERAYQAELSPDCRRQCSACGAAALLKEGRCDG
jgi:hypothetical protein